MRDEQEFIRYVFERYDAFRRRRAKRRRWMAVSSGVVLLLMITVIGGTAYLRSRDVPVAFPFRVQPKIVTVTTQTKQNSGNNSSGLDDVNLMPRLKEVLANPGNEDAVFRVLVWIIGSAEIPTDFVRQKMELLTAAGMHCESDVFLLGEGRFYILGTKAQIESLVEMDMGPYCRVDLALPGRPEGYSEVCDDNLAAYLELLEDGERVCVNLITAWDNSYTKMYRDPEIGFENEHRLFTEEIDALLQTDPEEVQAILNERIDAICRRYGVEVPGIYDRQAGIGYRVIESDQFPKGELVPERVRAAALSLEMTKEQALAMAEDPEVRLLQWSELSLKR